MAINELAHIQPDRQGGSLDAWRASVRQYMQSGLDIASSSSDIYAEMRAFDFAGARLWSVKSNSQHVSRTQPDKDRRTAPVAILQVEGAAQIVQNGKQCDLTPGMFSFVDAAKPLEIDHIGPFAQLYFSIPANAFSANLFGHAVLVPMGAYCAVDRPFYECALNLWSAAADLQTIQHGAMLDALLSLCSLTTAFQSAKTDTEVPIRVERAMAFIENHLGDEWLSAQAAAESQGVSRRYLDELFAKSGHRIESWIWERRLLRAAEELHMSSAWDKTVLQIALDLGFKSPSHFSRTFARKFGISPREYRKLNARGKAA